MDKNSQLHSGPETERQFAENQNEFACQEICNIISRYGIRKGADILADRIQRCSEKENEERRELEEKLSRLEQGERKRQKRRAAFIVVGGCIFLGIVLTGFFEWIGVSNCLEIVKKSILPLLVIPLTVEIISNRAKIPKELRHSYVKKADEGKADEGKADEGKADEGKADEGKAEGILKWLNDFAYRFSRASGLQLLCLVVIVMVVSLVISFCKPFEHARIFFGGGYVALTDYNNNNGNEFINNSITDDGMLADGKQDRVIITREMKEHLTGSDEVMIGQLDRTTIANEQRNIAFKLSEEDYYKVFSCWEDRLGEYRTQEQLNEKVLSEVRGWCGQKLDNVFNRDFGQGGAPQEIRSRIDEVSKSESPEDSFSKIADRLDLRESVVRQYPKRDLMQLVANDYQGLALRLVWHEGVQSTIIYYYSQSILYNFECLKFADNTDRLIKKRLETIAQRYKDIAYVCPKFEGAEEARRLAAAFSNAADQY